MLRKLGWLAVVLFVAADAILITLALRHTRADAASGATTTVTITTGVPVTGSDAPTGTSGPGLQGSSNDTAGSGQHTPTAGTGTAPTTTAPTTTEPTGTGGTDSTRDGSVTATSSTAGTGTAADDGEPGTAVTVPTAAGATVTDAPVPAAERMVLDMSSDGAMIRAVRGSCPATNATDAANNTDTAGNTATPATVEVSTDGGQSWSTVDTDAPEILRIGARRGGHVWYVGTDAACRPVEHDSSDGGASWDAGTTDGSWYLDPDPASEHLQAPAHGSDAGCPPVALAGIDGDHAAIACTDGTIRTTTDGGTSWQTESRLPGTVAISFVSAEHGYVLAATPRCAAQVYETTTGGAGWQPLACLAGSTPRGIAAAGGTVVAQVGDTLIASDDGGASWNRLG